MPVAAAAAVAGAYLLGSLSFAVIVSRAMGLADPRSYGSGNPGATNVLRSGRRTAALLTLLGDALKGALGVALGRWAAAGYDGADGSDAVAALCAGAAFAGHLYPVYFGFKGGKGVATFLGALAALQPPVGLAIVLVWLGVALVTRYASLASISAAIAALAAQFVIGSHGVVIATVAAMTAMLVVRHRGNLANLRAGRERRIGERAAPSGP
jgi:glycerol-3-phosphate acyltransferase PlsY